MALTISQSVPSIAGGVTFKPWLFLWSPLGVVASPGLLGLHEALKGLVPICPPLWNEKHLGLTTQCGKEERRFSLFTPYACLPG